MRERIGHIKESDTAVASKACIARNFADIPLALGIDRPACNATAR
jgi:hypothetical protein